MGAYFQTAISLSFFSITLFAMDPWQTIREDFKNGLIPKSTEEMDKQIAPLGDLDCRGIGFEPEDRLASHANLWG